MDRSETAPLFVVTGAPGSGKTSVLPYLVAAGVGRFVVADMDELLTDAELLGVPIAGSAGELSWPAYNQLWAKITMLVRRSGRAMVLLCPLEPAQWPGSDAAMVWMHLDCSDVERRRRLAGRRWDGQAVEQAVDDAVLLRTLVSDRIVTDGLRPAEVADEVAQRVAGKADHHRAVDGRNRSETTEPSA